MYDVHNKRTFLHKMFLDAWAGDTPALKKVQAWNGIGGLFGCGWCTIRSEPGPGNKGRYYYGYSEVAHYGLALQCVDGLWSNGVGEHGYCGHEDLILSDAEQRARAAAMDTIARPQDFSVFGCHETSPLVKHLSYVHYCNVWLVPIAHAFLFGLVKDFWKLLLSTSKRGQAVPWYQLSNKSKKLMVTRGKAISVTCDFNRPYRCIVTMRGNWVMENWLHWTETFSALILMPVSPGVHIIHDSDLRKMWEYLRAAVLFLLRTPENDDPDSYTSKCGDARNNLWEYAKLAQELMGHKLCKYNLHQLNCRLFRQMAERGHCAFDAEYWLESLVRYYKTLVRGHGTTCPELYGASTMLLHQLVSRMKWDGADDGDTSLKSLEEMLPKAYDQRCMHGKNLDVPDPLTDIQLLGNGKKVKKKDRGVTFNIIRDALARLRRLAYQDEDRVTIMEYQHAALGTEVFKSVSYFRARTRVSYYTTFSGTGGREYIAMIKYFVRSGGQIPDAIDFRLAVCDVFLATSTRGLSGYVLHVADLSTPLYRDEGMLLQDIGTKVVSMLNGDEGWFAHYSNASGLIDAVVFEEFEGDQENM